MANAWQPYADALVATKENGITAAGLLGPGAAGPALYAIAPADALQLTGDHYNAIVKAKAEGPNSLYATGLVLNGTKFMFLRQQDDCFLFRCGQTGIIAGAAKQLVIIAYYGEGVNAAGPLGAVQKQVEAFSAAGY